MIGNNVAAMRGVVTGWHESAIDIGGNLAFCCVAAAGALLPAAGKVGLPPPSD
jgi:hypothetical protein